MTKINLSANNRKATADFLEFLLDTYDRLTNDNIAHDIIVPHICGMLMTAEYAGLIDSEQSESLALALLIDECNE